MIDILLPTYNGEKFLKQQLDSIINQTYSDWRIIIRDDGSKDSTLLILSQYKKKYPSHFLIIKDNLGNLGTSGSNNILLKFVSSEYFMYCDQDDIWESNKIATTLAEMKRMETIYPNKPILVCSDACCIDQYNNIISSSFFANQKFIDVCDDVTKILALNIIQGSTAIMNNKLLEFMKHIPSTIFHDWWTAVICAYYGHVHYIHKPLLLYRQHNNNVVGANHIGIKYFWNKVIHLSKQIKIYTNMYKALPFKPNIFKWIYYKLSFNIRRL